MHVRSSMWRRHGHHENPSYESVRLHVVWRADTDGPPDIPMLELSRFVLPSDLEKLPQPGGLDQSLCTAFGSKDTSTHALEVIEAAGDTRFNARCDSFESELVSLTPQQALYEALLECMGYTQNKLPFRLLAQYMPYEVVASRDPAEVARTLQAASGLLPDTCGPLSARQWNLSRIRPANHPFRRINGIADVIARAERSAGLLPYLVYEAIPAGAAELSFRLQAPAAHGPAFIGPDRAGEAACNTVLPLAVALARITGNAALGHHALALWRAWPRTSITRVERGMRDHLQVPGNSRLLSTARHQQGLLHL